MAGTQAEAALSRAQQSMEQGNLEGARGLLEQTAEAVGPTLYADTRPILCPRYNLIVHCGTDVANGTARLVYLPTHVICAVLY
eukprot:2477814-Rhodomonas_salina.4